jgi:hypothetical protein
MGLFAKLGSSIAGIFGAKRMSPTQLQGSDGVYSWGGSLVNFERTPELRGSELYRTYAKLVTQTVIVGAAVRYFQNLVGGTSWTITPNENHPDGERAAEIVRKGLTEAHLESMPWTAVVRKAALYRFFGFSAHEWKIRRRNDGTMVFADIQHRPQHTVELWDIPPDGGRFIGFTQRIFGSAKMHYVWRDQMFYCVDNTLNDSPDGLGLLRHVVEHARRLARYEQLEGYGYESDLRGMPIGRVPGAELRKKAEGKANAELWVAEQESALRRLIESHSKTPNQGLLLDSALVGNPQKPDEITSIYKWAIELIKSEANGLADVNQVIERLNREIARVLGMEFLLLGGDGKGSLALSRDKTSMFASVLEATLADLSNFATYDLVWPLLRYNGLDPEECAPKFSADPIATERVEAAVAALVGLSQAGAVMDPEDPAINQIRSRLHLAPQPQLAPELLASLRAPRTPVEYDEDGNPIGRNPQEYEVDVSDLQDEPNEGDEGGDRRGVDAPRSKTKTRKSWGADELAYQRGRRAKLIMQLGKLTPGERELFDALERLAEEEAAQEAA